MTPNKINGTGLLYCINFWNSQRAREEKVNTTMIKKTSEIRAAEMIRAAQRNPDMLLIINSFIGLIIFQQQIYVF